MQEHALALIDTLLVENAEFVQFHNASNIIFSYSHGQALLSKTTVSRGLTLFGFIIKPVQRLCKYPLLIRVFF